MRRNAATMTSTPLADMSLADILNELSERYHVSPYQLSEAGEEQQHPSQDRLSLLMQEAALRLRPLGQAV